MQLFFVRWQKEYWILDVILGQGSRVPLALFLSHGSGDEEDSLTVITRLESRTFAPDFQLRLFISVFWFIR